ncbi:MULTISPECIES: bifunctional diaminohydroxyphosphoribosylaminopyrimidine deaminase/5-amino-6-(5-phosphoribosylamino)uracil reductase RibD [unclassified Delftia]|uniref:bifunctional diaminohydroxyphosphoribosylaminopyrimidine deaminase/5-amino-6-(5-phosphoribosylamino)uracil reductase RibD n=1 Tax=unclassified Delftia TaxID=2613839 RepID=UPI001901C412|nr:MULTISPECIES: bifunctional diaminohydroxyphosphoribosylaminopyrimidine deaminase/5-amino-6-(5-phosphoribosylamino)uracil reductase RibD [unclassified Delftia]MBK0110554.1 bifunctional diaminohydroxyphosphoribosylaminopyrimidine deaminase/5-amino-6-(5-phosphoribosylamino)uracil reductase RibD [Delftia sp. S65]MBK0117218.1 bifunctional diaminohydroxyphosphoribosylaminopyrimidine deaminase/5-amino-6-(5-phosphoribosylamino)uracil reductase RibD [Delftia sp. S67]MBK0129031.1 bifunctional diaminohy
MVSKLSSQWMAQAIGLATQALFITSPNPRVGCVIVDSQGQLLGQGSTQRAGGPHAEIMALRDAQSRGHSVRGATAYVTLEPCAHHGRTGPCCDALVEAGIGKVVASLADPNPRVGGQGFERLRAAGVEVEIGDGADQAWELNLGFFSRMLRGRPWVRAKVAASLDGITALSNGQSQWITSAEARHDGHAWRARSCAILTGIGTVLADNPRLDVREVETFRQPTLIVADSQLQTPPDAALFAAQRKVVIYTAVSDLTSDRALALVERGAQLLSMPDGQGRVDVRAMIHDLARLEVNELHVEAGHRLNAALVEAGLVDEWLAYLAPKLLWGGAGWADTPSLSRLADAQAMSFQSVASVGDDLRVILRKVGADRLGMDGST